MTLPLAIDLGADGALSLSASGELAESTAPAMAEVLVVLRTQKGACPLDPELGVDWRKLDKAAPNAPAVLRTLILEALAPLVADGTIRDPSVSASTPRRGRIDFTLTFTDAVTGEGVTHSETL